jgi:6-phosphogluconolactonase
MVMLGMGDDGHVASLFPHNPALSAAMDPGGLRRCAAMVVGPDGLPPLQPRMSLTLSALAAARGVLIYVAGAEKRAAVERALSGDDVMEMPVRALLRGPAPVRVICAG